MNKPGRMTKSNKRCFRVEHVLDNYGGGGSYSIYHGDKDCYRADVEFTEYEREWNISIYVITSDGITENERLIGSIQMKCRPSRYQVVKGVKFEVHQWYQEQFGIQ